MELNEKQFIAGFNNGYILAKYESPLITTVLKSIRPINSYISGMTCGQKEFESEQARNQLNELISARNKGIDQKEILK